MDAKKYPPGTGVFGMIRIRFHGRGGHGIKTASRIVGTAAFSEGYHVQDFPLYGAERRGAPITAYTRIADETILERGIIADPDVVIIADDSLIEDPMANPLGGIGPSTLIVINTNKPGIQERFAITARIHSIDATGLSLGIIGKAGAVSAALGGAACRILGFIPRDAMERAVIKELQSIGIPAQLIDKNVEVAVRCFESLPAYEITNRETAPSISAKTFTIPYQEPTISSPSVYASGNITGRQTGRWRIFKPVIHYDKCNKCWLCFVWCPEGAISLDDSEYPHIDYDHCKGCLICYEECPTKVITIEREVTAW